ncbi:phage tail sheath subtilisin-like domain-containing protein [Pseudomonas sp. GD03860]|uniref:phage tail sheath subtilisin-like domain-containing protein n=1 Tax=Pseudomonas sp. GD03860 TaxID=2975389 RepID=UPI00244D430E|nr:phage tail sheath subtilisin-like domain-containing protein [Pseudomonas sp. GD03860]MDH0640619.1 phage tail sheath subtilisin-like domain-containing protein [Pseudomonas sp. GD03860]
MTIGFETIPGPGSLRKPGVYSEIDNSKAVRGPQAVTYRRLLIGQKLTAGIAAANTLVRVTSPAQADTLFGAGSMLSGMVRAAMAIDSNTELLVLPVIDNAAGVAATGTVVFTGPATASGTVELMIAGRRVSVGVVSGDTPTAIAAAAAAAITAAADMPVTASAATGTVTLTCRHKGEAGNSLNARVNYYIGQVLPAGVGVTVTAFTNGAGNPALGPSLAAIGDEWLHTWAVPYTDAASLASIKTELNSRFTWNREIEAHAFAAARGTQGTIGALGDSHNSQHLTIVMANDEPMPAYEKAAETMAIAAQYAAIDPARPLQNLAYAWCLPPAAANRFTNEERNLLLFDGIATTKVATDGTMLVERLITTYKTNTAGASDISYLDSETLFTLMFIRHDWRDYVLRKYPRHKLADNGTRYGIGQAVVTPNVMKAEAIAKFREWEDLGLVENIDDFKANLIAERNVSDPNRLDMLLPPDLVNQLRIVANKIQFRL